MKKWQRALRLVLLIFLIVLASVGIGLTGAAPVLPKNRKRKPQMETKNELVEKEEKQLKVKALE